MRSRCASRLQRERHFHAAEEVALHPVRARAVHLRLRRRSRSRRRASARGSARRSSARGCSPTPPGMPGRSAHTPRTMRSIFTPAREARYSASIACGSTSAFIFAMMRAGRPARACSASRSILAMTASCRPNGDCSRQHELRRLREARELQEQLVHVLPDLVVAGEQAVVRVRARGARVVVARCRDGSSGECHRARAARPG